jgi:hypothetical protein
MGSTSNLVLACQTIELASFCYEESAEAFGGRAVEIDCAIASLGEVAAIQARMAASPKLSMCRGRIVNAADQRGMAISARRVPFALDLLAATTALPRGRRLAERMAYAAVGQ